MYLLAKILRLVAIFGLMTLSIGGYAQEIRDESMPEPGAGWGRFWVDVDGDGRDDYCYLTGSYEDSLVCRLNKQSGAVSQSYGPLWQGRYAPTAGSIRWVDINGDGYVDICRTVARDTPRLHCRLGPSFSGESVQVPWAIWSSARICQEGLFQCGQGQGTWIDVFTPGVATLPASFDLPDFHLSDVNGDGIPDLCYIYRSNVTSSDLRCRLAVVGINRATVSYSEETPAWTRANIILGAEFWPQGFYDFNGDGAADYCRVLPGGVLTCVLSSSAGFIQTAEVSTSVPVSHQWHEGAEFIDVNGDGKIDFCRLTGAWNGHVLRCTLSNGITWEHGGSVGDTRELISPAFEDPGHSSFRRWVDINGDGFPDFCRFSSPDAIGSGTADTVGTLKCRLGRGGGADPSPQIAFAYDDVMVENINMGRADGGRTFCDPFGTGIPVFCRTTTREVVAPEQVCYEGETGPACYFPTGIVWGYYAGYSNALVQARQSLLERFSDGVGAETSITYLPLANENVYSRSNKTSNVDSRHLLVQPRSPVVYETRALLKGQSNVYLTGLARYLYKDLRTDIWAGSRGFRERWIFQEGANTLDHTIFYQGLGPTVDSNSILNDAREVGTAKCQRKYAVRQGLVPTTAAVPVTLSSRGISLYRLRLSITSGFGGQPCSASDVPSTSSAFLLLQSTANSLGDTLSDSLGHVNPRFSPIVSTTTRSWDWTGSVSVPLPTSSTSTVVSATGDVASLTQITTDTAGLEWKKITTNTYFPDNTTNWTLGRLKDSTVRTFAPSTAAQLAARQRSAGSSPNATLMAPPPGTPPAPPPLSAAALVAIIQLLLND